MENKSHSDVPLPYPPYLHQEKAFQRLSAATPQPTIVATGTGSGKTECFLISLLNYCYQHGGQPGIKAILSQFKLRPGRKTLDPGISRWTPFWYYPFAMCQYHYSMTPGSNSLFSFLAMIRFPTFTPGITPTPEVASSPFYPCPGRVQL